MNEINIPVLHIPEEILTEDTNRYGTEITISTNFFGSYIECIRDALKAIISTVCDNDKSKFVMPYAETVEHIDGRGFTDRYSYTIFCDGNKKDIHRNTIVGKFYGESIYGPSDCYIIRSEDKNNFTTSFRMLSENTVRITIPDDCCPVYNARDERFKLIRRRMICFIKHILLESGFDSELDSIEFDLYRYNSTFSITLPADKFFDKLSYYTNILCDQGYKIDLDHTEERWNKIKHSGYVILDKVYQPSVYNQNYSIILESKTYEPTPAVLMFNGTLVHKDSSGAYAFKLFGDYKRAGMKRILLIDPNEFKTVYFKYFDQENPAEENIDEE